jgi:hypothetical protein
MIITRVAKTAAVAAIALFATLVTFGNLTDYDTNFASSSTCCRWTRSFRLPRSVPGDHEPGPASRRLRVDHRGGGVDGGALLDRGGFISREGCARM